MTRVLCVSNMWPGPKDPDFGAFVAEMCDALTTHDMQVDTAVIDRRGGGPWKYLGLLGRTLARARRSEVIYAHYLFPTGAIAAVAGALTRTPVVLTAHGQDVANLDRSWLARATAPGLRRADTVIAVSGHLADRLRAARPDLERVEVINMGVNMDRFGPTDRTAARDRLGLPRHGHLVLAVGGLTERKNPLTLLQAVARLRHTRPDLRLAFVGDGPLAAAVDAGIAHLKLGGAVDRPGALPHQRVADWVAACDVLAMVSRVEPLGVAALEGMAGGRAVVVTEVGGAREVIDPRCGATVDPTDPAAIATAIATLLDDPPAPEVCRAAAEPHALSRQATRVAAILHAAAHRSSTAATPS